MSFSPASPPVMPSQLDLATESQMKFPSHLILLISTVSDRLASKRLKAKHGVSTLGELAKRSKGTLISALGKSTGETLYNAVHGVDVKSYIKRVFFLILLEVVQYIYLVWDISIRFENNEQAEAFIRQMASKVKSRVDM